MSCIEILLVAVFWVLVIDISGFIGHLKGKISKWLTGRVQDFSFKPWDCSLCMSWWTCFIIILINGWSFKMVVLALFISCMTGVIKNLIMMVTDFCYWMINKLWDIFQ